MTTRFDIQIVALDKFTKVFRDLNNSASKAARPIVNVNRQIGALSKEMHLDKLAKGMGAVSGAAVTMTRTIGLSLGPFEQLMSLGGRAGVVGALAGISVATLGMTAQFARSGLEVTRTSARLNVSTRDLQRWRGAAGRMGLEADTATGALETMGEALHKARMGDPVMRGVLNHLGIGIPMKNGAEDPVQGLEGMARVLSKVTNPFDRKGIADYIGFTPDQLQMLQQGVDAIRQYGDEAERAGMKSKEALEGSVAFTKSLDNLKGAWSGLTDRIGGVALPPMTNFMNQMSNRLEQSKQSPFAALTAFFGGIGDLTSAWYWPFMGPTTAPQDRRVSGSIGGASSAVRGNNPGNLRSWKGVPTVNGFAYFPNQEDGLAAMAQQLGLFGSRGNNTLSGILNTYAPPSENDTGAYVKDVSQRTGFAANQALNLSDPKTLSPLMAAMVRHEQGRQPYSSEQYDQAAQKVDVRLTVVAPPGTKATATGAGGAYIPTRIAHSMPTSGDMP